MNPTERDDCPAPPPFRAGLPALLLHEACETAGGVSRLARLLEVPVERVARWLVGDEAPPEAVFRACAEIVLLG
jgi:hypothetical protein